jgi:ferrous iron transport protein B
MPKDTIYKKIVIVGPPNVGKSSIFNNLTGYYATVSNYPGTTVELFKAKIHLKDKNYEIIDTPGMNSFLPLSEEERVARLILIQEKPDVVLCVGSAKNLDRILPLTLQILEAGLSVILILNILDEAEREGIVIDKKRLEDILGIPVFFTISVKNKGVKELIEEITSSQKIVQSKEKIVVEYSPLIEKAIKKISSSLEKEYSLSRRALSLLFLQEDEEINNLIKSREKEEIINKTEKVKEETKRDIPQPIEYLINLSLKKTVEKIIKEVVKEKKKIRSFFHILSDLTLSPWVGLPLLVLFLYFGLYQLVGRFGAGVVVDFLETVFKRYVSSSSTFFFEKIIPYEWIRSLFVGEYGIITLGLRYAIAIVLPIVGIFFFIFSFIEDIGYLPRIGAMLDRLFKKIGLSGRAVIPIILGLGCDTMATVVTRILPTRRERIIATFLLSLSIPCSAQLGVIISILSRKRWAFFIWLFVISFTFGISGFFLNKILKGKQPSFYIELPPLRLPRLTNIFTKTYARLKWYFKEVLPLFIWASVIIWLGQITKIFNLVISLLRSGVKLIGLPQSLAKVFLFGFFRRDYGAAGLYDLEKSGALSLREMVVAAVVLTLFLPCIAQFLVSIKERGAKVTLSIAIFILFFSFTMGFFLNKILIILGVN